MRQKINRRAVMLALAIGVGAAAIGLPVQAQEKKRILVVSHTAGFRHRSIPLGNETIQALGERTGQWQVDHARTAEEVQAAFTPENLRRYDLVFFNNTTGELPISEEGKKAFLDWVRGGKAVAGVHAATDTFYKWPEFGQMIGGYFDGHPWHQKVVVRVEDPKHPSTQHLGSSFEITDEIYQFRNWERGDKRVLLSIDPASIDTARGKRSDKDYAVAWVSRFGNGRVFYSSLGHREEVWQDPRYQEHLIGGLRWALALAPGSTETLPAPAASTAVR
jgi:type 1 glutamine amidotransferase